MRWIGRCVFLSLMASSCTSSPPSVVSHRSAAEGFFRGIWGCSTDLIDEHGAEDAAVSYPIFESLYGTQTIRGREAVKELSASFCSRWGEPEISVHEAIEDGNRVVLLWSFSAIDKSASEESQHQSTIRETWGGISVFRIDARGRVVEELGEESSPGPVARLGDGSA